MGIKRLLLQVVHVLYPHRLCELGRVATERLAASEEVTRELLDRAITEVADEYDRNGRLYFALDDRELVAGCGHYLIYGSEYLQVIAASLRQPTGRDYLFVLNGIGIPTVFAVDLPLSCIDLSRIRHLSGQLLEKSFEQLIQSREESPTIDFSVNLDMPLLPNLIVSHYHPTEIRDDVNGDLYRPLQCKCPFCDSQET
jgi:hypothetical protein